MPGEGEGGWAMSRDLRGGTWEERLAHVMETMRQISRIHDPQEMVRAYASRMRGTVSRGHTISLSRRGLTFPTVRVTRSTQWEVHPDPWREPEKLPLIRGGLLAELIYADEARIIAPVGVGRSDPAYEMLSHAKSLVAIPHFEDGAGLNMVLLTSVDDGSLDPERLPDLVLQSNLFGRGTKNLVLTRELGEAYEAIDREMRSVQDMQLALLPPGTPVVPGLDLATHYQTSHRAGGDYYDFFELPDGRLGVLVADVSGHGTPAAVMMAIVHAVAHLTPGEPGAPEKVLEFLNRRLCERYTRVVAQFVTAIYGVYDPSTSTLVYANAGHPEVLVRRAPGRVEEQTHPAAGPPLGVLEDASYAPHVVKLGAGESFVLYTDGITEAFDGERRMYGKERLAGVVGRSGPGASDLVGAIVEDVGQFAGLASRSDDRTLVVGHVR